jgi:tRNA G18 (ribose-2'-O)-methylase SpoU
MVDTTTPLTNAECPKGYMLMFNIQKAKNFGTIVRSAAAFNLSEIFLVEPPGKKNKISTFGS